MTRIIRFELEPPYRLAVVFADGKEQAVDLEPVLKGELYGPLKDPVLFRQVYLDPVAGTLAWPNGADFDPDTLYHWDEVAKSFARQLAG
ncbi:MAG: DUF2442 domain-containing protein [Puniceicoccaceae bacterium]